MEREREKDRILLLNLKSVLFTWNELDKKSQHSEVIKINFINKLCNIIIGTS